MTACRPAPRAIRMAAALVGAGLLAGPADAAPVKDLVVLANRNVPASVELAQYYAAAREIPENRILQVDLPDAESISREDYERRLRDPLLAYLRAQGLAEQVRRDKRHVKEHETGWTTVKSSLRYLVTVHGIPLRIEDTKPALLQKVINTIDHGANRDGAAVDSELCMVLQDAYDLRGRFPNPYYNQIRWDSRQDNAYHLVMVGRLDGPAPEVVRRMIDDAVYAGDYGLHGRAYFDLRAPHNDDYRVGDYWLEEAHERFRREGYECAIDRNDIVLGNLYPMDDAALYLGWYTDQVVGPFTQQDFAFRRGAIAYHNHSGNAKSLRTTDAHWAGPLLARGAAATLGAVNEPFLNFTPNLDVFADRLCSGYTFGESAFLSLSALSWQITVVGDPLYRPFGRSLDEQIKRLEEEGRPEVAWAYLRRINLLARDGRLNVALNYCREKLRLHESRVLREKLADLYAMNELYDDADVQYARALAEAETVQTAMRIGTRYLLMLRLLGHHDKAAEVESGLRKKWADSPFLALLEQARP